jgi:hypothetical protein
MRYPSAVLLLFVLSGTFNVLEAGGGAVSNNKSPLKTDKSKIQMLQAYAPAMNRDPDSEDRVIPINVTADGECSAGERIGIDDQCKVHPLAVAYMQEDEGGGFDIHAAVSLDEGSSWKRINLSNNAKRSSTYNGRMCFTEDEDHDDDGDGEDCDGGERRRLEGLVTTFTFHGDNFKPTIVAKGNKILVAWTSTNCKGGVPGNQGDGDGPYGGDEDGADDSNKLSSSDRESDRFLVKGRQMCHANIPDKNTPFSCVWAARGIVDEKYGTIVWSKPERLTSGRRDALQLVASAHNKAWALAWQEDPRGMRVGEASGPGDGMSGATVNHKTDIWYSYLSDSDFPGWEDDLGSSRMNIVENKTFSVPVRVTDNAACKVEHKTQEDGTPIPMMDQNGYVQKGAPYCQDVCHNVIVDPNPQARYPLSCETETGIPLNGDTGASRPNMFLIDDSGIVRVVLAYEESKGLGKGPAESHRRLEDDDADADEREDWGKNIYYHTFPYNEPDEIEHGMMVNLPELTKNNEPAVTVDGTEFLTKNARRVRMIVQPPNNWGVERLAMVLLYREGEEGHGHPAHIIMRRFIGGYMPGNLECTKTRNHPDTKKAVCVEGSKDLNEDNIPQPDSLDDARAHRGFLRGDFLVVGYTYTDNWGRGNPDRHDLFVRRSFDGGKKWTNANGVKEGPVNLSNVKAEREGPSWSVMEPRLFATPGTIGSTKPKHFSDVQNSAVYYVAYSTTHKPEDHGGEANEKDEPMDLVWTMTDNYGESYKEVWNDVAEKWQYPWFAKVKGANDDAGFAGAQIQTNPAGTKVFASFQANVNNVAEQNFLSGGSPCRGNGVGSDVCANSTLIGDTLLLKYDLNDDKKVDSKDEKCLQIRAGGVTGLNCDPDLENYDLNGDGIANGQDLKLFRRAVGEYLKRTVFFDGRRTYLRHRQ